MFLKGFAREGLWLTAGSGAVVYAASSPSHHLPSVPLDLRSGIQLVTIEETLSRLKESEN